MTNMKRSLYFVAYFVLLMAKCLQSYYLHSKASLKSKLLSATKVDVFNDYLCHSLSTIANENPVILIDGDNVRGMITV